MAATSRLDGPQNAGDVAKVKKLADMKKMATSKAGDVLQMEGTLARLVAENAKHASAVPADYNIKRKLDTKGKEGLETGSTSKQWMANDNNVMLEKARNEMKKAIDEEYAGKRARRSRN